MAQYLSDIIAMIPDGILTASVKNIGDIELNKNQKEFRKITFFFPSTGKELVENVFQFNFVAPRGNLVGLKVGDTVEMKNEPAKDGKLWPIFKILSRSIETGAQPSQNNGAQVKAEQVATQAIKKDDEKSIAISLQGLFQAFIIRGETPIEALRLSVECRAAINAKAHAIYTGTDTLEKVLLPEDVSHAFPPQNVSTLANKMFGQDTQATL